MTSQDYSLLSAMKQYFGFNSFRPLQEDIMKDVMNGRDVFALLPTGGGKSLCYQLPALLRPGLTLVVSPLISLMKDQVHGLEACGVPAVFINSSLHLEEAETRLRGLRQGKYRLLYIAPEKLMSPHFLNQLKGWNVTLIAIDEAHCISEWGHDFRPEYRELSDLRDHFPKASTIALTATATTRVRSDILHHLRLRNPGIYIASFNRPNLNYSVIPKENPDLQVLTFIKERRGQSGIIYCQSRKTTEDVAEGLRAQGVKAAAYHAGLSPQERSLNQDMFLRDDVEVICATIAFGMGINKSNVRFVIHHDLAKNIEGYYQETGRSGRDGLPSECVLLFSAGDLFKQSYFIENKQDPKEREIAKEQLNEMMRYAETAQCRRKILLRYFGETFEAGICGACDNCLTPRPTFDGTLQAQKLLSCVYRIREKSGFGVGLKHVIAVLTGANTEKIRRWCHQELSTYGIGMESDKKTWSLIAQELIRLGFLGQSQGKFRVLELTHAGRNALNERIPILLTQPASKIQAKSRTSQNNEYDEILFDRLRRLRKKLADERSVPAYIVFSDAALRQMARDYPTDNREFVRISGVGENKLREFGLVFLTEISTHLEQNPRRNFLAMAASRRQAKPRN